MLTFENIRTIVCCGENITEAQLNSKCRRYKLVFARQLISYFCRKYTLLSLTHIGARLNKNHATILHGCKAIENLFKTNKYYREKILAYERKIEELKVFQKDLSESKLFELKEVLIQSITNECPISKEVLDLYNRMVARKIEVNSISIE